MAPHLGVEKFETKSRELVLLESISSKLSSSLNLKETLTSIFEILDHYMGLQRGILRLVDPFTEELYIEMAYGLTEKEKKKEAFKILETVTAEVLATNRPVIIPDLENEESDIRFASRPPLKNLSYICLPITLGDEKIGTFSVDCPYKGEPNLDGNVQILSLIALLIAQEVKLKQLMEYEKEALRTENMKLKDELTEKYNIHNIVGKSGAMHQVFESIIQVAHSNATVLIRGESGTGKELVAHALHYNSPRRDRPFIKINCGAIPESLIESELFGYEKGAFTGADGTKIGKFEAANTGTIFLDEIGELSPAVQVKLLRVLQEKEIERVGDPHPMKINVRVITATNRDLEKEVEEGIFRQDLYYRLNVFPIFIPPLRERRTDVLLLAEHFLDKFEKENSKKINRISAAAVDLINSYHWPGNVRELENCMERGVLVCGSDTIQSSDLPHTLQKVDTDETSFDEKSFTEKIGHYEKELIIDALQQVGGNKSKAAKYLKTTQRIIGYKIKQLGINA
jgi:Nif-specific regulatory protein